MNTCTTDLVDKSGTFHKSEYHKFYSMFCNLKARKGRCNLSYKGKTNLSWKQGLTIFNAQRARVLKIGVSIGTASLGLPGVGKCCSISFNHSTEYLEIISLNVVEVSTKTYSTQNSYFYSASV